MTLPRPLFALLLALAVLWAAPPEGLSQAAEADVPEVPREFRAAWIATVANIDWPSAPGLPVAQQKAELRAILDRAKTLNLNAIIFQVRPMADALYQSDLEPWSEYLTGEMGRAPEPFYDPLAFAVEEAHRRGLELHAWFNPFRARHRSAFSEISEGHVSATQPRIVREYGTHLWLDPGEPAAHDYSVEVILDVVRRYEIDGVHIDDYFYPYKERDEDEQLIDFPDDDSYARAVQRGVTLERDDWRRDNVDRFVQRLYAEIKAERQEVRFGISPFGIWRPGYPEGIEGFDAYSEIYADALKWYREGWLDYFTPQLYWPIDQEKQSYPVLLTWWQEQNVHDRHLWPGNFTSRVGGTGDVSWPAEEIIRQIELTRDQTGADGNVHFSMRALMRNPLNLAGLLAEGPYAEPALVPATTWLGGLPPIEPSIKANHLGGRTAVSLEPIGDEELWLWAIQYQTDGEWRTKIVPGWQQEILLPRKADRVAARAVNRLGMTSGVAEAR